LDKGKPLGLVQCGLMHLRKEVFIYTKVKTFLSVDGLEQMNSIYIISNRGAGNDWVFKQLASQTAF
jgi:hypothetical protein